MCLLAVMCVWHRLHVQVTSSLCCIVLWLGPLLQSVGVTLHSPGGHSSMPPVDSSSIGARLGAFLSSLTASPPAPRLVSPTRELVEGGLQLSGPWQRLLARLVTKVSVGYGEGKGAAGAKVPQEGSTEQSAVQ